MQKRLLFLYLKTGGGHLAPAKAVASWLQANKSNEVETVLVDGFTGVSPLVKRTIEDGYRATQGYARWVYEMLYAVNKLKVVARLTCFMVSRFVVPALEKQILAQNPDKIVVFHFFLIKPVKAILKKHGLNIPVLTVVTDPYTAHPVWYIDKEQNFLVFSESLKKYLVSAQRIDAQRVSVFPFIINEKFTKPLAPEQLQVFRQMIGLRPASKVILVMGGADGIPRGKAILKQFITQQIDAEIVMVCGNNKRLFHQSQQLKERNPLVGIHVFGYVDFVYELLNIADLVITKCGASTFMEVLVAGKVPLINSYLWEQEKGNVEFVTHNGLGFYEKRVSMIPSIANLLITNAQMQEAMRSQIGRMGLSSGTIDVSNYILNFSA